MNYSRKYSLLCRHLLNEEGPNSIIKKYREKNNTKRKFFIHPLNLYSSASKPRAWRIPPHSIPSLRQKEAADDKLASLLHPSDFPLFSFIHVVFLNIYLHNGTV